MDGDEVPGKATSEPLLVELLDVQLELPWDLEFLPDDSILVNQQRGEVKHVRDGETRLVLLASLVLAFGFAFTSFLLSGKSRLALTGVVISAPAVVLGGNTVEIEDFNQSIYSISLDWLLIDILVLSAIFVPVELFLPKRIEQTKFHLEWKTDFVYFAIGHLLVQFTAVAVKAPAELILDGWGLDTMQSMVSSLPFLVQLVLAILIADLFQYTTHRAFHSNRFLWRPPCRVSV